jgi:hypothetical protein
MNELKKWSKLALNNGFVCPIIVEMSFLMSMMLRFVTIILVSSANKIGLDLLFIIFGKSFI